MERQLRRLELRAEATIPATRADLSPLDRAALGLANELERDPVNVLCVVRALVEGDDDADLEHVCGFVRSLYAGEARHDDVLSERLARFSAGIRLRRAQDRAGIVRSAMKGTTKYFGHDFDPLHPCAGLSVEQCVARVGEVNQWPEEDRVDVLTVLMTPEERIA